MAKNTNPSDVSGWVGWVYFGGLMMILAGILQSIEGLVALFKDDLYLVGEKNVWVLNVTTWGWVHLRGKVKSNVATDMSTVLLATLPSGFRPTKKENFITTWYSPALLGSETNGVTVEADGKITPYALNGGVAISIDQAGSFLSLDGIRFKIS